MSTPIRSVDELCVAVEDILTAHLEDTMAALGFTSDASYQPVKSWRQLPVVQALDAAVLPAGAIAAPTLIGTPAYDAAEDLWRTTWQIPIAVYERGRDHDETQARIRNRCAAMRMTLLANRSLGGKAVTTAWAGENHNLIPNRTAARTIAAGGIAINVTAYVDNQIPTGAVPVVDSTAHTLTLE